MKATGIVRRIDDLGRVVIPKEIRRTLHIREGDPLEIFTERDGTVVFKKYSPLGGLGEMSGRVCEALYKTSGWMAIVCDRDQIVAAAGAGRRELRDRAVSARLESALEERRLYVPEQPLEVVEGMQELQLAVAAPILAGGDVLGGVLLVRRDAGARPGDMEQKLAQLAALFLGRQLEE